MTGGGGNTKTNTNGSDYVPPKKRNEFTFTLPSSSDERDQKWDVIIVGAGLSGLTTAYRLQQANIPFIILEARDRLGGRILTVCNETGTPIEMGATWLGKKHTAVNALLRELKIGISEQYMGEQAIYEALSTSPPQLVQLPPKMIPATA